MLSVISHLSSVIPHLSSVIGHTYTHSTVLVFITFLFVVFNTQCRRCLYQRIQRLMDETYSLTWAPNHGSQLTQTISTWVLKTNKKSDKDQECGVCVCMIDNRWEIRDNRWQMRDNRWQMMNERWWMTDDSLAQSCYFRVPFSLFQCMRYTVTYSLKQCV